jgi:hypothetical protein
MSRINKKELIIIILDNNSHYYIDPMSLMEGLENKRHINLILREIESSFNQVYTNKQKINLL